MKLTIFLFSSLVLILTASCNKEHECVCEGNAVGVKGTWKENAVGYETAKAGCEIEEACTWTEIN